VVDELSRGIAAERGCYLSLWRWETDARPGMHREGPQGLIDGEMKIEDVDVVVGIFWKHFGTPTSDADSGTEHQLRRSWDAWLANERPDVMGVLLRAPTPPRLPLSWRSITACSSSATSCPRSSCGGARLIRCTNLL
jgi:hypothetical protein